MGFGEAALGLSTVFEMTPPPLDLVGQKDVTIPITFVVPPSPPLFRPSAALIEARAKAASLSGGVSDFVRSQDGALAIFTVVAIFAVTAAMFRTMRADRRIDL